MDTNNSPSNYTDSATRSNTNSLLQIKKILIPLLIICIFLVSVVSLSSCAAQTSKTELFDQLVTQISNSNTAYSKDVNSALTRLGLNGQSTTSAIDQAFIESYLETHTHQQLFDNLFKVCSYIHERYVYSYESNQTISNLIRTIVTTATTVCDIPMQKIDFSKNGAEGFYSQHTANYPPKRTWTVEGKFFNDSDVSIQIQKRTCTATFSYYGDFAVENESGYRYESGYAYWANGTYYERDSKWKEYNEFHLGYKGKIILDSGAEYLSKETFWSEAKALQYFCVGDSVYFLHSNTRMNKEAIWIRYN